MEVAEAGARRRPRGRTAVILACAAVLGLAGGTAYGYGVQADRAPEPLPALSQPKLEYPAKPLAKGEGRKPLERGQDRLLHTEGDLRTLLVARPEGSIETDEIHSGPASTQRGGFMDLTRTADEYRYSGPAFRSLMTDGLRRTATRDWSGPGDARGSVRLLQFAPGSSAGALAWVVDQVYTDPPGEPLKGSDEGRLYVRDEPDPGTPGMYSAEAYGARGDLAFALYLYDSKPVSESALRKLAEDQLERL
ncbi:hypothetical protein AB0J21_03625 [Streptomyces sp. NPDC049954]|uniref:hypothetical protein n=1 Tax=Streptomyces sp. NPDC049954 TaxID=3155779 RepID=UPI003427FFBB